MDEAPIPQVDADVRVGTVAGVVEHEVAGLELAELDGNPDPALRLHVVRQHQAPSLLVDVRYQPAAVEAGERRAAAEPVSDAEAAHCLLCRGFGFWAFRAWAGSARGQREGTCADK